MSRHRSVRTALLSLLALPGLLLGMTAPAAAASAPAPVIASDCSPQALQRADFPASPKITNHFYPLVPGTQFFLDGSVIDEAGVAHPHRIATTVTDLTKVVNGVNAMVIFDVDIQDGVLQESELFFVSQREDGSVWTLGEYPEEYDNGQLTGAPSTWISGTEKARAGIAMLGHPTVGTPTYLQGLAPKVDFKDCATVFQTGEHVCVKTGCYDNVLETDEFAPLDPEGGHQRKFNAPGVGVIKVAAAGGVDPEALQLTKDKVLCKSAFASVRQQVLEQDARGYQVATKVYGTTTPAVRTLQAASC
jgi:hypothetical protein